MVADDKGEDRLRAVSFAAGTAAFMACIERAFMVSVFMHWRVWAFLALNLLLLAILFTSKPPNPSNQIHQCPIGELKRTKKIRHRTQLVPTNGGAEPEKCAAVAPPPAAEGERKLADYDELSEEELKQRVEDFIAMFRQHLVCDAKTVTSRVY
ncbi:uncharacterized protein LOC131003610 [Salvia miltiorrhiza]|uniref:uncharacterized protein LOC131003610 n=1 Tax=Salvia miltiorrhiza TaxID=226208 RepID=UPI0025AC0F20|nr:uncharacterized protein LOC131003610 [Salvia miltiorrhiza]